MSYFEISELSNKIVRLMYYYCAKEIIFHSICTYRCIHDSANKTNFEYVFIYLISIKIRLAESMTTRVYTQLLHFIKLM